MKIRFQLLILVLIVTVSFIVLAISLQLSIKRETKSLLYHRLTDTKNVDVPKTVKLNTIDIVQLAYDYSVWDQMVDFVLGKENEKWAEKEIVEAYSHYQINDVWVLDSLANTYYYKNINTSVPHRSLEIPQEKILALLKKNPFRTFYLKSNNSIFQIFTNPIQPTLDLKRETKPRGYFLIGRRIDTAYVNKLNRLTDDINFALDISADSLKESIDPSSGKIEFSYPLKSYDDKVIAQYKINRVYPDLKNFDAYLEKYITYFLVIVLTFSILFYFSNRALMIKPLKLLSNALQDRKIESIEYFTKKKNEYGELSRMIKEFFIQNKKLQDEVNTRTLSEQQLQLAYEEKIKVQTEKNKIEEFLSQQQEMLQLNGDLSEEGIDNILKEILVFGAASLKCERAGIWLYDEQQTCITSKFTYNALKNEYTEGGVFYEKDYPVYFNHLKKATIVAANDALKDNATTEFVASYLKPQGITSMLDVAIRVGKKIIGIVCYEHTGTKRVWSVNEKMFARTLSDIIAINLESEQRRKIENKLKASQLLFEETQELAQIGSWEFDLDTQKPIWSKEMYSIFELTPADDLYKEAKGKFHSDDFGLLEKAAGRLFATQKKQQAECRVKKNNGEFKYVLIIIDVIVDKETEKITGLRGTVQDISIQKKADLVKSDFLSTMSHEIRTPLNGIIGISNLMTDENLTKKQKEYVDTLIFSAQHLSTLVSDILDFSKIESGQMVFENTPFQLNQNCEMLHKLFLQKADEKHIELIYEPDNSFNNVLFGDFARLNQVLTNLLSNAVKFTNRGRVTFSYSLKKSDEQNVTIEFKIKDTGIGMSEKDQQSIFESFSQANATISRKYGGTGLGLAISKKLVVLQGGTIGVNSVLGEGSEFNVELSFKKYNAPVEKTQDIQTTAVGQIKDLSGLRVLIAEDNKTNAMVITSFFKKWKIENAVAKNGIEAIDLVQNNDYDIILMDLQMPVMDGKEATRIIRASNDERIKNVVIIALTADASSDTLNVLLNSGFDHYMTKPFNPDTLYNLLQKIYTK